MRMLLGTDGSSGAGLALDLLLSLPLSGGDEVVVTTAVQRAGDGQHAERIAGAAARRIGERGARASVRVRDGPPVDVLYEVATEEGVDLVVVGSRGLGAVRGALFGSTARALARLCPLPLLVVRGRCDGAHRIVVATNGHGRLGLDLLARLPLPTGAEVTVTRAETARDVLAVADGSRAQLIVLSSPADRLGGGFLNSSVVDQVLSQVHCAVLVARPPRVAPRKTTFADRKRDLLLTTTDATDATVDVDRKE